MKDIAALRRTRQASATLARDGPCRAIHEECERFGTIMRATFTSFLGVRFLGHLRRSERGALRRK